MSRINVDDARPGMVLASDLFSEQGRLLLPKGTEIEDRHLRILNIWGVTEVDVVGVERDVAAAGAISEMSPEVIEACRARVEPRFVLNDLDYPPIKELFRQAVQHEAQAMQLGRGPGGCGLLQRVAAAPAVAPIAEGFGQPEVFVSKSIQLVSLPDVYYRVVEALNDPRSSAIHLAEVISADISLSAKLLRLVNSPAYGFSAKIDTIPRAVALVGGRELTNLALGVSVISCFREVPCDLFDLRSFWKHSVACGMIGRTLAGRMRGMEEDRFFMLGLLHDIGRLVLLQSMPQTLAAVLLAAQKQGRGGRVLERVALCFDHAQLAAALFKEWSMPAMLVNAICWHHRPLSASEFIEPALLHLSDIIAIGLGLGVSGSCACATLDPAIWDRVGLTLGDLALTVAQADRQIDELVDSFL